jgi:peptidoglycan biosynthesis protein MviN/MurJ (putative lipid II flippase)
MKKINLDGSLPLAILSFGNIGSSFLLQILMFAIVGVSGNTDLFIFVSTIPLLISSVISGLLNNVLLPYFSTKNRADLNEVVWEVMKVVFFYSLILSLVVYILLIFAFRLQYFATFLDSNGLTHKVLFFQILAMFLSIIYSVVWSYSNSIGYHFKSEFIPFLISLGSIPLAYYLLPMFGVVSIAFLLALKYFLSIILQIVYIEGKFINYKFDPNLARLLWRKIRPIFFSSIYYKSDLLVERFLLMNASIGSLSILNLAQQLVNAGIQVITKAYNTPTIKKLSKIYTLDNSSYTKVFNKSILYVVFLLIISIIILYSFPDIFYYFFYYSDSLKGVSDDVWLFVVLLSGVLISNCIASLINSSFYISGDTTTPSRISSLIFTFFLPVKVIIYNAYGIEAMVFSTSVYCLVNLAFLIFYHKKKVLNKCYQM